VLAIADRGYCEGEQIRSCTEADNIPMVQRPNTSPAQARGLWGKPVFTYEPDTDTSRCPVGEQLQKRHATIEAGKRIRRWEHEAVLDELERMTDTCGNIGSQAGQRRWIADPRTRI
jgi:hypothetical protein